MLLRDRSRRLASGFAVLVGATYALIVLGALVRSNDAGLACPDWPLCFGEWVPQFDVRIAFEWAHRVVAGGISIAFVALGWATLRDPASRRAAGGLLAVAALLLAVQILLGALTVWELLASWTVTSHLLTGNAFAVALLLVCLRLREDAPGPPIRLALLRPLLSATALLLVFQVALGGLVASQYLGLACPDWPSCIDGVFYPGFEGGRGIHLSHRTAGYGLVVALALCALAGRREARVRPLLWTALGLCLAQVAVGVANVLLRLPVEITALHSALATALILTVAAALRAVWTGRAAPLADGPAAPSVLHRRLPE